MDLENGNQQVSQPPTIRCHITIDGTQIGFVSRSQMSRFLKLRTYVDLRGNRHVISGLQSMNSGVTRSRGNFYYNHNQLSKEVGYYNYHRRFEDETEY